MSICENRRISAVNPSLKVLTGALVPNGDMFLFVVVSRQKKNTDLCVLCVSAVNHHLRKSA